jgi:hypothetical protein
MADINRIHVSPGIYASETVDMKAAANSIGVTKLALVGETLKGPAFQPYWVHAPKEYASVFGGTSPKKFVGSKYPKYELPYIANEYLKKGTELCVVRTLGFSGYNAGPAWVITGEKSGEKSGEPNNKYVIAVLRSRGGYKYRPEFGKLSSDNGCPCNSANDSMTFDVGELSTVVSCGAPIQYNMEAVKLSKYFSLNYSGSECSPYTLGGKEQEYDASYGDFGRFTIECIVGPSNEGDTPADESVKNQVVKIPVSLNKSDKDYIIKVLGTSNSDGDQPLYVESLYDTAWEDLVVNHEFDLVSSGLTTYNVAYAADYGGISPVVGILSRYDSELKKKDMGKRYLYAKSSDELTNGSPEDIKYYVFNYTSNTPVSAAGADVTMTESEAITSTIQIPFGEAFKITNGQYEGIYYNTTPGGNDPFIRDLMTAVSGQATQYSVKKATGMEVYKSANCVEAHIYTVVKVTDNTGKDHYVYKAYDENSLAEITDRTEYIKAADRLLSKVETSAYSRTGSIVYNYEDGLYYKNSGDGIEISGGTMTANHEFNPRATGNLKVDKAPSYASLVIAGGTDDGQTVPRNSDGTWCVEHNEYKLVVTGDDKDYSYIVYQNEGGKTVINNRVTPVVCDLNDYKTQYRYSSTPWVVSNAKGDANNIDVNKLFRFHTISDGDDSITEVKVSIENIRPDTGEFDVVVRSYGDGDASVNILERFSKCTMAPGKKSIAYKIGTLDGMFESKSKYITVEVVDSTAAQNSVPAGFLGYPVPRYDGATIAENGKSDIHVAPITYNTIYDEDVSKRKQYFGISDRVGYDYDYFSFKGKMASLEDPLFVSNGFHLDCRLNKDSYGNSEEASKIKITVDGVEGYVFDTVSVNARTSSLSNTPIIASEDDMAGSIFEDVKLRKFTMAFYGGFDGWDEFREQRTNTDDFSATTYKGYINNATGVGYSFDVSNDASSYGIEGRAITSDYYSTLAGVSLLKNPEEVDINLLATPGIDTINNTKLVNEVFNILEDRADTFYIVTTPDKENGAGDYAEDIPDVDEIVSDFEDKEVYSDYAATYYPWVKIEDNGEYLWIPATRDVVRNLAESDNTNTTMNLAPAGTTRGHVEAIRARKNLKNGESDALYEANINPVRTYAQEGVVIMGQKTLRQEEDLLNRVDVRRMVLRLRKLIAIGCIGLIFEPYDNNTVKSFRSIITGIMQTFIDNRAIERWTMDVDDSQEARDRLELGATIVIKPVRALEYITLNFVVTNNDVYFDK